MFVQIYGFIHNMQLYSTNFVLLGWVEMGLSVNRGSEEAEEKKSFVKKE